MMKEGGRSKGRVNWFNPLKGYGFITPDDGKEDIFVHQTEIRSSDGGLRVLTAGEVVEYVVTTGSDGKPKASDVTGSNGTYVSGTLRFDLQAAGDGGVV